LKHLCLKTDDGLPKLRITSQMRVEDDFLKLFAGRKVTIEFLEPNSLEFTAVYEEKTKDEPVSFEDMTQKELLVHCAKEGVGKVDGRSSKANIIAALRTQDATDSE